MKKIYTAPALVDLGSVRELTLAANGPNTTDKSFPANTPRGELTFS